MVLTADRFLEPLHNVVETQYILLETPDVILIMRSF
jgi:hypothetical protein